MPTIPYAPAGCETFSPYLIVRGAVAALDFYHRAFGAEELFRMPGPDGRIMHATLRFGTATLMLADEFPEGKILSPESLGGSPVCLCLYVPDADAACAKAVAAGATFLRPVADQFYGERSGYLVDPFGHRWNLATVIQELSGEEMLRRAAEAPPAAK